MDNRIEKHYCSFEVSKLLREKGFAVPTDNYWEESLNEMEDEEDGFSGPFGWRKGERNFQNGFTINSEELFKRSGGWYVCSAPLQSVAIEWLEKNFNIWIAALPGDNNDWVYIIYKANEIEHVSNHPSIAEALEAGLKYALEKLI